MSPAADERIRDFFEVYAAAALAGDAETVSGSYFSTYIEAAPSTIEAFKVDDEYRRAVETKAGAMRGLGLAALEIKVTGTKPLAPYHLLVEAEWRLCFAPKRADAAETRFRVSYVVRLKDGGPVILLALSHEDEEKALRDLGLA
ncbi:hypothetical protein [Hoeflea sp. 108]|jgi:hypothetical protein|uniref:hypothetical protein n=1 Tax=Hoeflea sp. 108 TaxID=1116369 RepID=UPI00037E3DDD|nr:hypothetical protein [Hoeflea sp. 108]